MPRAQIIHRALSWNHGSSQLHLDLALYAIDLGNQHACICAPLAVHAMGPSRQEAAELLLDHLTRSPALQSQMEGLPIDADGVIRGSLEASLESLYHYAKRLEEIEPSPVALSLLYASFADGYRNIEVYFTLGRALCRRGSLQEALSLYATGILLCIESGETPWRYGTSGIPNCFLGRPNPEAFLADLVPVEACNLMAEDQINHYSAFDQMCEIFEIRDQYQTIWKQKYGFEKSRTLVLDEDWSRNFGHFGELVWLIKLMRLDLVWWKEILLLGRDDRVSNAAMLSVFEPHLNLVRDPDLAARLEPLASGTGFRVCTTFHLQGEPPLFLNQMCNALEARWEALNLPPVLTLPDAINARGPELLDALGLPQDAWFACLHVRDSGFHYNPTTDHRNASIQDYIQAIRAITSRGGWVVRLGDPSMPPLPPMERVIDYPHHPARAPWADVYLCARCHCFIGLCSGISYIPYSFGIPMLVTNQIGANLHLPWPRRCLSIPKLIRLEAENRLLRFEELLSPEWQTASYRGDHVANKGGVYIDNTPDELEEATVEFLDFITQDTWSDLQIHPDIKTYMTLLDTPYPNGVTRPSPSFLKRHRNLL